MLCTGDELLTGLTADTNSPYLMGKLYARGVKVARSQTVGDVMDDIVGALRALSTRAEVVLVSGGLGPTADDLTAEAAALAAGVELLEDAAAMATLKARFVKRGIAFTQNNAKQALFPEGATIIPNPVGSAAGFSLRLSGCTFFFVPGVPREYRALVDGAVLPAVDVLLAAEPGRPFRASRLLKTVNLPESHLDERVKPLAAAHPTIEVGFRTHGPENHLKLCAIAPSQAEADRALAAVERDCRAALSQFVFGADDDTLPGAVVALLLLRGKTLAVAESCTGGELAASLTAIPGVSGCFKGGAVVYTDEAKRTLSGVPSELLAAHGAVSESAAAALATGIQKALGTDFALSITGLAGPGGGTEALPVGTVFIGLADENGVVTHKARYPGERERVRQFASHGALDLLFRRMIQNP